MLKMTYGIWYNSRVCSRSFPILSLAKDMSSSTVVETKQKTNLNEQTHEDLNVSSPSQTILPLQIKSRNRIVAAAFASLHRDTIKLDEEITTPQTDSKISKATNVEELLSVSNGEGVSRRLALKIVSVLADWTSSKKIKLTDFENDYRFIKLCKVLTKFQKPERDVTLRSEDLSTVLGVTADEEAAKLVQTITLPQMVKVMKTLSYKKRRSMLLLRTLAYNICGNVDRLNLKLSSDLLYSMSSLNFIDENLLSKVALDICTEVENDPEIKKSAVIGSILTSLGLLKYKNPLLLDSLSNWLIENCDTCRSQDVFSLFLTLATLNYLPADYEKLLAVFKPYLTELDAGNPSTWLEHIWAKVLLNLASSEEISYILSPEFLNSLAKNKLNNISTNLKILNINGAADCLIEGYKGNKLPEVSLFRDFMIPRRKEKREIVEAIVNSLKNLMNSEKYLKVDSDTGYGFSVDVECILDDKCSPKEFSFSETDGIKVAIQPLDYHDMTKGRLEPLGISAFTKRILKAKGYEVLTIPYNEFNSRTKLITKVQYLEKSLKELVKKT